MISLTVPIFIPTKENTEKCHELSGIQGKNILWNVAQTAEDTHEEHNHMTRTIWGKINSNFLILENFKLSFNTNSKFFVLF
jgi:hypothetical protein